MQQYPVPQNITGFEFKLIGALTLKQFGYLTGAAIVCFLFYITIGGIISFIFITPIASLGAALAFANISGMKFEQWLASFTKAITQPSQRVWRKETKSLSFLSQQFSYYLRRPAAAAAQTTDRSRLKAFLAQVEDNKSPQARLDNTERKKLQSLDFSASQGSGVGAPEVGVESQESQAPSPKLAESYSLENKEGEDG